MTHEEIQTELSSFALGVLDVQDERVVQEHLATGCPTCRQELATWEEVVGSLALACPEGTVAPNLKPALLQRVRPTPRRGKVITLPAWSLIPLAAAAAVLVLGVTHETALRRQLAAQQQLVASLRTEAGSAQQEIGRLAQQLAAKDGDLATLRAALAAAQESLTVVQKPGLQMVRMQSPAEAQPSLVARAEAHALISSDTRRALFYAFDLPAVAADKTYELWWITEKEGPVRAGLFVPDARGFGRLEATLPTDAGAIQAAAVTVEPAGGVVKPTGPMVLKPVAG